MSAGTASRRRRLLIGLALASVGALGVGASLTTAAWTDDVWAGAGARTATVELRGAVANVAPALTPANWPDADTPAAAIALPATSFANLVPDETRAVSIWLWNSSPVPLSVSHAGAVLTGDPLFDPALTPSSAPATIGVYTAATGGTAFTSTTMAAGATLQLWIRVTTPNWTSPANDEMQAAASNGVDLWFTGTTTAP